MDKYRIVMVVEASRWTYHLGQVPETKFMMGIQVYGSRENLVAIKHYDLTSAQFIKARDLQNKLVGCRQ